jgi:hypothetical protein
MKDCGLAGIKHFSERKTQKLPSVPLCSRAA